MSSRRFISAGALPLLAVLSTTAQAAVVCNGGLVGPICTLAGPNVNWVFDVNTQNSAGLLFGAPSLLGDAVRFIPSAFIADAVQGAGATSTTAFFVFDRVYTNSGGGIVGFTAVEQGDYFITNGASVSASLYTQTSTNNGAFPFDFNNTTQNFSANVPVATTVWNLSSFLTTAPFAGPKNDVTFGIQNTLQALGTTCPAPPASCPAAEAFIQKKFNIDVVAIPVPAAVWLFGSGLGGLLSMARRRRTG